MNAIASHQAAHVPLSSGLTRGAIGGLIGGMAMAMFSMFVAISEDGFWAPVRGITSVVFGDEHYGGGFDFWPVAVGAMGHMMNSVVLGAVFALLATLLLARASTAVVVGAGMAFGLMVWLVMVPGIAAQAQSSELFVDSVPAWAWIAGHLMFGAVTAAVFVRWRPKS
jgi:hypothetical protein